LSRHPTRLATKLLQKSTNNGSSIHGQNISTQGTPTITLLWIPVEKCEFYCFSSKSEESEMLKLLSMSVKIF
jgi:hypothetical protein